MDEYADLDIVIQEASAAGQATYPVSATYAGQRAVSWLALDPTTPPWPEWQARLIEAQEVPGAAFLHQVGTALYQVLFQGEIAHLWAVIQGELEAGHIPGVRIRLAVDPPAIAALPWELLYDERRQRSVACHPQHPLVRAVGHIGQVPPWRDISLTLPLRVLFVAPQETSLDWRRELKIVQDALTRLGERAQFRALTGQVPLAQFSDILGEWQPHVIHFTTHGDFDGHYGWLMLSPSEENRESHGWIRSDQLRTLLDARGESVRLAVLGVCQSARVAPHESGKGLPRESLYLTGLGPALIQAGIPAVIGMQFEIRDTAALLFTHALYRGLLEPRRPGQIDAAVAEARAELKTQWPEQQAYAAPVLFLNAPHGRLFTWHSRAITEPLSAPTMHLTEASGQPIPSLSKEELLSRFGHQTLRELRRMAQELVERIQNLQDHLSTLRQEAPLYQHGKPLASFQPSFHELESQIAKDRRELDMLRQAIHLLEEAHIPEELTVKEFEAGTLTAAVLEAAVVEQPYEQAFSTADVVHWLATAYPVYWARVIQRIGDPSRAEQAVFHRLAAMAAPESGPSSRPWFLIRHGNRFKRVRY